MACGRVGDKSTAPALQNTTPQHLPADTDIDSCEQNTAEGLHRALSGLTGVRR